MNKAAGEGMLLRGIDGGRVDRVSACLRHLRAALFYIALTVEIAVVIVDKSDLHNPWESYIFRGTFALTLLAVLLGDHTVREWAVIACGALFGAFCYRVTGRNEILRFVVFVAACPGRSKRRMLETAFWETLSGCVGIALLSALGIFGARTVTESFRPEEGEATRYCLGFGHPNALHAMFFMLVLLGILTWAEKMKLWHYAVMFLANTGVYLLTDSRTGFGLTALAVVSAALFRFVCAVMAKRRASTEQVFWRCAGGAGIAAVLFCVAFSVWAAADSWRIGFDPTARGNPARVFNRLLTDRIADLYWVPQAERADVTAWTLFSSPAAQRYFDMGWCRLFYWYGIVPAALGVALLLLLIMDRAGRHDAAALVVIVCAAVYTVPEAHLISVYIGRNFLLLLFGAHWSEMLRAERGNRVGPGVLIRRMIVRGTA